MSTSAHLTFDQFAVGILLPEWQEFCAEHELAYSPNTVGQNVYYAGAVEVSFGEENYDELPKRPDGRPDFRKAMPPGSALTVTFSTYIGGPEMPAVLRLAVAAWLRFGGALSLAPELRELALHNASAVTSQPDALKP